MPSMCREAQQSDRMGPHIREDDERRLHEPIYTNTPSSSRTRGERQNCGAGWVPAPNRVEGWQFARTTTLI